MRVSRCECFEMRCKDRDYKAKGSPRVPQMEVFGGASATPFGRRMYTDC
jgi:hypothetical protein